MGQSGLSSCRSCFVFPPLSSVASPHRTTGLSLPDSSWPDGRLLVLLRSQATAGRHGGWLKGGAEDRFPLQLAVGPLHLQARLPKVTGLEGHVLAYSGSCLFGSVTGPSRWAA